METSQMTHNDYQDVDPVVLYDMFYEMGTYLGGLYMGYYRQSPDDEKRQWLDRLDELDAERRSVDPLNSPDQIQAMTMWSQQCQMLGERGLPAVGSEELDEEQLEALWADVVRDRTFGWATPDESPVLLNVGGQPGAGKTRGGGIVQRGLYPGKELVFICGDDFRRYYPGYVHLCADPDPSRMPTTTASLSAWIIRKSLAYALERGYSVKVEGTLRDPATVVGTIREFHRKGFSTHLVVLGVPEAVSWQRCVCRYCEAVALGKAARWAPKQAHDAGFEGVPRTLEAAQAEPAMDKITVVDQDGEVAYSGNRNDDFSWADPAGALSALQTLRSHPAYAAVARFDANQSRLEEQSKRCGFPPEVDEAIAQTGQMGRELHARLGEPGQS